MSIFKFRDSWEVWRHKVDKALGTVEEIDADEIVYDNTSSHLTATNAQSAIDELNSNIGGIGERLTTAEGKIETLETASAKGFKITKLFEGDASANGADGVEVTVTDVTVYDELMIYYNAGNIESRIPVSFIKAHSNHTLKMMWIDDNSVKTVGSVTYVSDEKLVVKASQGSTFYLYGIQYKG